MRGPGSILHKKERKEWKGRKGAGLEDICKVDLIDGILFKLIDKCGSKIDTLKLNQTIMIDFCYFQQSLPAAFVEEAECYWERATWEHHISLSTKSKEDIYFQSALTF